MDTLLTARRTVVEHLPLFLQLRRRKWTGLQTFLDESHLPRPAFFLLRALEGETTPGQPLTLQQMQNNLFNPYATRFTIFEQLPLLIEQGYLQQNDEEYVVTEAGRTLMTRTELAARDYIGSLELPSSIALPALAQTLVAQVYRSWQAPEPLIKAHQARTQRRLAVAATASPLVQIEWAVLGLWEARDDAHIASWQAYHFSGPTFDILSHIWRKEAQTLSSLTATLAEAQTPTDIQQGIQSLIASGYIQPTNDHLELTPQGQRTRDAIEDETDRIFFAPWHQTIEEYIWLARQLSNICSVLP